MTAGGEVSQRVSNFGLLGTRLEALLIAEKWHERWDFEAGTTDQLLTLTKLAPPCGGQASTSTQSAALSLLYSRFPVQVRLSRHDILNLVESAYDFSFLGDLYDFSRLLGVTPSGSRSRIKGTAVESLGTWLLSCGPEELKQLFPTKIHPAANLKCNVKLRNVLKDLRRRNELEVYEKLLRVLAGKVSNDQVCSAIIYASGLRAECGDRGLDYAAATILQPANAKGLSNAIKALGANSDVFGAMFVEGQCLMGRASGSIDLASEAAYRCDESKVADTVLELPEDELRAAVRAVLEEEIVGTPSFLPLNTFWATRWSWCVNGSHSRILDRHIGPDTAKLYPGADRVYRRMYAEAVEEEPITGWDGTTYVSASEKLEHGKTRAIFSCDTRSYFAFEHFLSPVEKVWSGKRVILDPGKLGHLGLARLVSKNRTGGGVNVMLDYDDFNSHHSNDTMRIVFSELGKKTNYPEHLLEPILESFSRQEMYYKGRSLGLTRGTLMSGHRATTFLNSILNAVYIRMAVGEQLYSKMRSLHVGDDVCCAVAGYEDAGLVLDRCRSFGCRMNPSKQSVGTVGAEFLRMGIRQSHAVGYFARGVASAVSGNWGNLGDLGPLETIHSFIVSGRTLINRSGSETPALLLATSAASRSRMPLRQVISLLTGAKNLAGGPVFKSCGFIETLKYSAPPPDELARPIPRSWPSLATHDYLSNALRPLEIHALESMALSVVSAMLSASHSKAITSVMTDPVRARLIPQRPYIPIGSVSALDLVHLEREPGVLSPYPVLHLLKDSMSHDTLLELVMMAGGNPNARDLKREAWGAESTSKLIEGWMSYGDASSGCAKTSVGVIYSTYSVRM